MKKHFKGEDFALLVNFDLLTGGYYLGSYSNLNFFQF